MTTLSITIIVMNAAGHIRQCLESVKWANEIIVLDSGSTDNTVAICREYTDKVFVTDWPGFGIQKNRALAKASSAWVLSLDADEVLTPELQTEIQQVLCRPGADAYYLTRRSFFCGHLIRFGDWRNDKVLRLFKRELGQFDISPVHEKLMVQGHCAKLAGILLHYTADCLEDVLEKNNRYSSLGAAKKLAQNRRGSLSKALIHGFFAFTRNYILKLGILDGRAGFVLAVLIAECTYYRYLKAADFLNSAAVLENRCAEPTKK